MNEFDLDVSISHLLVIKMNATFLYLCKYWSNCLNIFWPRHYMPTFICKSKDRDSSHSKTSILMPVWFSCDNNLWLCLAHLGLGLSPLRAPLTLKNTWHSNSNTWATCDSRDDILRQITVYRDQGMSVQLQYDFSRCDREPHVLQVLLEGDETFWPIP